jgi:hypothetical protein
VRICAKTEIILTIFSVVSRWLAEIVGADEEMFQQWNRMELAGVCIMLECPR